MTASPSLCFSAPPKMSHPVEAQEDIFAANVGVAPNFSQRVLSPFRTVKVRQQGIGDGMMHWDPWGVGSTRLGCPSFAPD